MSKCSKHDYHVLKCVVGVAAFIGLFIVVGVSCEDKPDVCANIKRSTQVYMCNRYRPLTECVEDYKLMYDCDEKR